MPLKRGLPKLRASIALFAIVGFGAALPLLWRSDFVTRRRAALHLERAQAQAASGQFDKARSEYRASLRLRPGGADARRQLAALELSQGNWEVAFLELQSLTEMHPEDVGGWVGLADLMAKMGWLEAPEAALDQAIEAAPGNADAHERRGEIRFRLGRYAGARADARAAVAASPGNAAARVLLVRSAARSEGAAAGIDAAIQGIAAVGRVRMLLLPLARLLNDGGRWEEAIEILEETAGTLDGARAAQLSLARAKWKAGAHDAARQLVAALTEGELGPAPAPPRRLRPDAQTDFGRLGAWTREHWPGRLGATREALQVELRQERWTEAQRIVDSARSAWPETSFAPFLAGTLELARGQVDQAERRFSEAMVPAPRFPTVVAALARAWGQSRGAAFAGDRLMGLAERDPGLASARYMAARAYVEARDPIKAEAALRRGLRLQPDSPVPYQHLTDYYFGLDRTREALDICREGLQRFPQAVDLQLMLAQISASLGRTADAVRLYDDLLSRRPDLDLALYKLAVLLASQEDQALRQRFSRIAREVQNDRPSDPLLADALGWVQFKAGSIPRARELLGAAVIEAPDEPGVHFHLAALYAREHEQDLARGELKLALDSPRPFAERLDALRLLRETPPVKGPKDDAGVTSARH